MNYEDAQSNMPLDLPLEEMLDTIPPTNNPSAHAQPVQAPIYSPIFPPSAPLFSPLDAGLDVSSAAAPSFKQQGVMQSVASANQLLLQPSQPALAPQPRPRVDRKPSIRDWSKVECMRPDVVTAAPRPAVSTAPPVFRRERMPVKRQAHPSDAAASADVASTASSGAHVDVDHKKQMRAERNRQSAAASRERKKKYVNDLQQRAQILKQENEALHSKDLLSLRQHNEAEQELANENFRLRREAIERDMEMRKLMSKVEQVAGKVEPGTRTRKHNTWDPADLQAKLDALGP